MPIPALTKIKQGAEKIDQTIDRKSRLIPKWLLITVAIFLSLAIILSSAIWLYQSMYHNKIYTGAKIAGLSLGGKNKDQAIALVHAKIDDLASSGIQFTYNSPL